MEFCEILEQLLSRIIFFFGGGAASEKKIGGGGERRAVTLVVPDFHFFQGSYLLSEGTMFFFHKFFHSGAFQFGLFYPFYISKKGLSNPVFSIKILVVEIIDCY